MDLCWTVDETAGVSLVQCQVHNDSSVRRRIRIVNHLDGPVLPPRRRGVPEAGWDQLGVTVVLAPDERRAIGFAVPAAPVDPPVSVTSAAPPSAHPADDALRTLGAHRPPRDACVAAADHRCADGADTATAASSRSSADPQTVIDDWFASIESRLERAERLTGATLSTATEVVAAAGGLEQVTGLDAQIATDAEQLRQLSERASTLADRTAAVDPPTDALERLA